MNNSSKHEWAPTKSWNAQGSIDHENDSLMQDSTLSPPNVLKVGKKATSPRRGGGTTPRNAA